MKDNHKKITKQSLTKQIRWFGTSRVSKKRRGVFGPEEKWFAEDIK